MRGKPKGDLKKILADAAKHDLKIGALGAVAEDVQFISTGNIAIDHAIGGGVPLGRSTELYGFPASGKSLPIDEPVLTPDRGFIPMGEIQLGDRVVDPENGEDSRVIGVFPQGSLPVYRLTFSDGTWAEASGDHLWEMYVWGPERATKRESRRGTCGDCDGPVRARGLCIKHYEAARAAGRLPAKLPALGRQWRKQAYQRRVLTTDELRALMASSRKIQLPAVQSFDFAETELPLDPYVLGVLLGDGSVCGNEIRLTCGEADAEYMLSTVSERLPDGIELRPRGRLSHGVVPTEARGRNSVKEALHTLDVRGRSWEKSVPSIYKYTSFENRREILRGLMDTDGSWQERRAVFTSSSAQLADDVAWLARSLGLTARTGVREKTGYRNADGVLVRGRPAHWVDVWDRPEVGVFSMPRKQRGWRRTEGRRQLASVEYIGDKECQCIKVSARSELFVTRDFIPTHNTTTALQAAATLQKIIKSGGDPERGITGDDMILYLDYEHAMDPDYAAQLGLDIEDSATILFAQPDTLEEGANYAIELIETGMIRMLIVDSVAAMMPSAKAEAEIGKSLPAVQAKLLGDFTQKMNPILHNYNCAAIYLNHLKEVMSMGGRPGMPPRTSTPGGVSLKFYSSVRVKYAKIKDNKVDVKDPLTGTDTKWVESTEVEVKVEKNKVGRPFRTANVRVRFGRGFDNFYTAIQILLGQKRIIKSGAYFYLDRLEKIDNQLVPEWVPRQKTGNERPYIQGEAALFAAADEHPEWRQAVIDFARNLADNLGAEAATVAADITTEEEEDD